MISKYNILTKAYYHVLVANQNGAYLIQDSVDTTPYISLAELVDKSPEIGNYKYVLTSPISQWIDLLLVKMMMMKKWQEITLILVWDEWVFNLLDKKPATATSGLQQPTLSKYVMHMYCLTIVHNYL